MKKKYIILISVLFVVFLSSFAVYQHEHENVYTLLQDNCKKGCQFFNCKSCGFHLRICGKCDASLESTMQGDPEHDRTLYFAKCKKCSHESVWAVYYKH